MYFDSRRDTGTKKALGLFGVESFHEIRIKQFAFWLVFIISLLIVISVLLGFVVDGLDIAWAFREGDPLTWLSSLLLLLAAFICRAI